MGILILVTGGTFDKEYDEISGQLFFRDTHIGGLLRLGRSQLDCRVETLMLKDSLEMTDPDRQLIRQHCLTAREPCIVITHGTDTMTVTAALLAASSMPKTIVLTGAMIPFSFGSSDGLFNMGSALSFVQVLPHGVYIAMNGKIFDWDKVRKNRELGRFEAVTPTGLASGKQK
jgi:L-asparaginase